MASSGSAIDGVGDDGTTGVPGGNPRNPLTCGVCHDYYNEPCLLSCFHTFCARCIHGPHIDGTIKCPICGQQTQLKDGAQLPPSDQLIRQLVELANCENPPCANCDKRDKSTMFFCTTCGQALCTHCREHTHRAKMFSSHEVVHMSKCAKDTQRRCPSHGEQYIMFSQSAKCMLCASCFRDTPPDARVHCVDIESAWQQASKKMERAVNSICELQAGIKDGVLALKSQLDELRHSLESEKRALTAFCQGMQEAINKTHAYVLAELQRQFDTKERMVRTQLLALGNALPVLQMHLMLCTAFTTGATKYQFLELAHPMLERLSRVAQLGHPSRPPLLAAHIKTNYRADFARALHPYIGQIQNMPKAAGESLYDQMASSHTIGQSEPQVLQSSKTTQRLPPKSGSDGGPFSNHCRTFDTQLKELSQQLITVKERLGELQRDVSVLKRANTPPLGTRYEHVARDCRVLEQQLEHHQMELERLRNVFDALWEEQMCRIHLEKEIFHSQMNDILSLRSEVKKLQILAQHLEPFVKSFSLGIGAGDVSMAAADAADNQHLQALLDHLARLQMQEPPSHSQAQAPTKDHRHPRTATSADNALYMKETKEIPTRCRTPSGGVGAVLDSSGNIVVYGTAKSTDPKRGVLSQLIEKARTPKDDRKKSPGREDGRDRSQSRRSRKSPDSTKPKTPPGHSSGSKMRSLYRSLKGGTGDNSAEALDQAERCTDSQPPQSHLGDEGEYQRISEASSMGEAKKRVQAQVHAIPSDDQIRAIPSSKVAKIYPASDSEELFYGDGKAASDARRRRRASCDSLSTTGSGNSRRSSIADGTKQRSWETFPRPKSKRGAGGEGAAAGASSLGQLKKADSFEGHEEAVRTLVAAVQETRSQLRHHHLHHHRHHRKSKTN